MKAIVNNWLCPTLETNHIHCVYDVKDCRYGRNIEEFERKIGKAETVLIVLSKSYFYSFNCMFELALIMKTKREESRLIIVSADDYERNEKECVAIYDHWKMREAELEGMKTGDKSRDDLFESDLEKLQLILKYFPKAWEKIRWKNTLSFEAVSAEGFKELQAYIKGEVMNEDERLEEPNLDVPMEVGDAPDGISIVQNGEKSVAQVVNGGNITINM